MKAQRISYVRDDNAVNSVAGIKPFTMMGKVPFGSSSCEGVYELKDGRIIEVYLSQFGFMRYACVFANKSDWNNYTASVRTDKLYRRGL